MNYYGDINGFINREHFRHMWWWWIYKVGSSILTINSPSSSLKGKSFNLYLDSVIRWLHVIPPLSLDMDEFYGALRGPCWYLRQLALLSWVISSKNLIFSVIYNICIIHWCLHLHDIECIILWHLKWPSMDDYHEFKCAHIVQIKKWLVYWSIMFHHCRYYNPKCGYDYKCNCNNSQ
jgi:hypothetical protein